MTTRVAIVGGGNHVLVELGFTPRDLLPPEADELTITPSPTTYSAYEAGQWAYPPRDLEKTPPSRLQPYLV